MTYPNPFAPRRMPMKITPFAAMCLLCLAIVPLLNCQQANDSDAVAAITKLENEGMKADLAHDTSWVKKNVADDYVAGTSFGDWETKASMLKDAEDPANKLNSESLTDMKVNVYGNTAIARYVNTYDDMYKGQHRSRKVICTDTWVNESGAWKEVANHCSQAK
jgi:Domain of unknown function (DUF4440)